jgi:hypothetical protein
MLEAKGDHTSRIMMVLVSPRRIEVMKRQERLAALWERTSKGHFPPEDLLNRGGGSSTKV